MAYAIRKFDYSLFSGSFRAGLSPSVHANEIPGSGYESSGSLQGWWRLNRDIAATVDGPALDSSVNGFDGTFDSDPAERPAFSTTLYPSQSLYVQGPASCTFDGVDDVINIGNAARWNAIIGPVASGGTAKLTIAAWVYKTGATHGLVGFGASGGRTYLSIDSVEHITFATRWSGGATNSTWQTPVAAIPMNTWAHVAVTYDAGSVLNEPAIYVDGVYVTGQAGVSWPGSGTWNAITTDCFVGARSAGAPGWPWEGQLADVAIWNTILTAEEIKAIYEISSTGAFLPTRNYDLIGSHATPPYTGSYGSTLQGVNITTFKRFGMSVAPKMGRSDRPAVFLSSSSGMIDVTPEKNNFFDAALRLPQRASFESKQRTLTVTGSDGVVRSSTVSGSNQQMIGDDSFRVVQIPQYILNHQAYGLETLFVEKDPFVEMDQFSPVIYINDPLRMAWPVVMENPSPLDPFDFNGAIEPFALRRPLAGFSTFMGNAEDPEPTGMRGSVSSGMMQDVFYKRSVVSTNFYFPANTGVEPFEMIGASEEYDELPPRSISATGSLYFSGQPTSGETLILSSSERRLRAGAGATGPGNLVRVIRTYTAASSEDTTIGQFQIGGSLSDTRQSLLNCINDFHSGSLRVINVPDTLWIFQVTPGYTGNTVITSSLSNVAVNNFDGGSGIWKPIHAYVKQLPYMTEKTSSVSPFVDETSPEDAFYYVSNREIRNLLEITFTKADRLGVPSRSAKSAACGWSYENSTFGIDSIAFGGLKK